MKTIVLLCACLWCAAPALAQDARPGQDTSIDGVVKTLYSVISGPAGERDWAVFRSLFHSKAGMGAVVKYPGKNAAFKSFSPEDYIRMNDAFFKKHGFNERELHREVFQYGNIAHVLSSYESVMEETNERERGINALQLVREGGRWYVLSLIWKDETDDQPLPKNFIKQ